MIDPAPDTGPRRDDMVFGDLFSRHDISGWGKAGWMLLVVATG
jgi:hypothetical protein